MPDQMAMNNMNMGNNVQMGQPVMPMNGMAMGGMQMNPAMMGMGMGMGGMQMNPGFTATPMGMNTPNVQSLQFPGLQSGMGTTEQGNIGLIMDVYMEMTVELGRTKKQIKEPLNFIEV